MKKAMTTVAAATLALISAGAVAAEHSLKLSGSEIRARFAGMQLTDEVHWRDVCERDGSLRSYTLGKKTVGRWVVEKDELCLYFKEPDDGCYVVWLSGDRIEMKPSELGLSIEGILQTPTDRN
jgi:hypothetical protein